MAHKVGIIGGDGIGPEVIAEGLRVIEAAGVELDTVDYDLGGARYLKDGVILTDEILDEWRGLDALYLGAVGAPDVPPGVIESGSIAPPPPKKPRTSTRSSQLLFAWSTSTRKNDGWIGVEKPRVIVTPSPLLAFVMPVIAGLSRPLITPLKARKFQVPDWTLSGSETVTVTVVPSFAVIGLGIVWFAQLVQSTCTGLVPHDPTAAATRS